MRALEFGPLEELISEFGQLRQLEDMPSPAITNPSVLFKTREAKKAILPWDVQKAMELWKKRGPYAPKDAPDLFASLGEIREVPPNTIGHDRLVLKARNMEEFMYYTTDHD